MLVSHPSGGTGAAVLFKNADHPCFHLTFNLPPVNNRKSYLPVVLLATSALILALPAGATSPVTTVTLFPNVGPTSVPFLADPYVSPSFAPYVQNVLGALQSGSPSVGDQSVDPTAFNPIGSPIVNGTGSVQVGLYDIFAVPANTWRGTLPTSGPFAGEFGTWFRPAVHIVSDQPFTTTDVLFHFSDPDFQAGGDLRDFYPEASTYVGLDWGAAPRNERRAPAWPPPLRFRGR